MQLHISPTERGEAGTRPRPGNQLVDGPPPGDQLMEGTPSELSTPPLGVIVNLENSCDVAVIQAGLNQLPFLFRNCETQHLLIRHGVHKAILIAISHPDLHKDILKLGLSVLAELVLSSNELCWTVAQSDTYIQLLGILENNGYADADLYLSVMRIFAKLLQREEMCHQVMLDCRLTDMTDTLCNTVAAFPADLFVLVPSFTATRYLLAHDHDLQASFMQHKLDMTLKCLMTFKSTPEITEAVFSLLEVIASNDKLMGGLVAENVHTVVLECLVSMRNVTSVVATSSSLLCKLCRSDSVKEFVVTERFLETSLIPLLFDQSLNARVQQYGLELLCMILKYTSSQSDSISDHGHVYDWCQVIHLAMSKHLDDKDVQVSGCCAISALLEYKAEMCRWIGEDAMNGQSQYPIHTLCLGAILMFHKDPDVCTAACEAIYWLAADHERLSTNLMERNCHVAIMYVLTVHLVRPDVVEAGCRAIRGLCIFHEAYKYVVIGDGIQSLITMAMDRYPQNPGIQIEAVSTLACLADIDLVRNQCFIDGIHYKILAILEEFDGNELLQEACLECLSVLSSTGNNVELMNVVGTVTRVLTVLQNYMESVYIQRKGLILLQVLASDQLYQDRSIHGNLAKAIGTALSHHITDLGVVKEACVAMQILSEGGGRWMSDSFIKEGCHEMLFSILQHHNSDQGVQDLASECLYVLGLEQVLRSKMLVSACSAVNLPAAECLLELGADVNFVQDGLTPLYVAVDNQNEDLVRLLLKQHITDIQSALKRSLENQSHQITGLLLGHINKDREGKIMCWSGQGLSELHPVWFVMALSSSARVASSESGKLILTKIKKSQEKRRSRSIVFTNSESKVQEKYLRYQKERRRHFSDGMVKPPPGRRVSPQMALPVSQNSGLPVSPLMRLPASPSNRGSVPSQSARDGNGQQRLSVELAVPQDGITPSLQQYEEKGDLSTIPIPSRGKLPTLVSYSPLPSPPDGVRTQMSPPKATPPQSPKLKLKSPRKHHVKSPEDISPHDVPVFDLGLPSPEGIDPPVFEASRSDLDEWKTITLTGARVPYNPSDPRLHQTEMETATMGQGYRGEWKRKKSRSPSPSLKSESSFHGDISKPRLSMPILSSDGEGLHQRQSSEDQLFWSRVSSMDSLSSDQETKRSSTNSNLLRPTIFDLSCNELTSLQSLLSVCPDLHLSFSNITKLYIHDNQITSLPGKLFQYLPRLEGLDVKHNCLREFPSHALTCRSLGVLDLSHNKIEAISDLEKNKTLRELYISHNNLRQISPSLTDHLHGLEVLLLASNNIEEVPDSPLGMAMLQILNLSDNHINAIPDQFLMGCPRLEALDLSNNGLVRLPSEDMVCELTRLAKLRLAKNKLMEKDPFYIPKFILELPSLRSVDLSGNGLVGLPAPLHWKSSRLKEVLLCHNQITKLNLDGGKTWSKLEALNLSNNNISELPKEIGQLTSLTSLDISYNRSLTSLPDELGRCSKMWEMPLKGIGFSLDKIHRGKVKDLIAFLHNKLKKATRYYRMKLMVVGYGGRGKSTLLGALMKQYRSPQHDAPTVGVIVQDWKYERQRTFDDFHGNVTYTINTWDFAGQEEFYSTHQCYLTDRAVYLVVMDLRQGLDELTMLRAWLANIHARAPGCPVIVVGTHADCVSDTRRQYLQTHLRAKLRELVMRLGCADVQDLITVDCTKENPEMERLREFIKDKIDNYCVKGQPVMGQKVPADYVKLAEALEDEVRAEQMTYPVITHAKLLRVVEERRLDLEEEELKQAVRFLHQSGVVLHYEDAALQLKDLYFIDPGWLCRMMAQVVTVRQINPFIRNGILRKSDMELLFTGKKVEGERTFTFPPSLLPQYIRLLEKFEIALHYTEREVLIPCHLPEKRPDLQIPHLKMNEKICRHYTTSQLPLGLWSRLITRLIAFSSNVLTLTLIEEKKPPTMKYWKKGIFGYWSDKLFYLLDNHVQEEEAIHLTVPATPGGSTLFGLLVDHVCALVEEWYPGLTSIDPILGRELLTQHVPCIGCTDVDSQKLFPLDDLIEQTRYGLEIYCSVHKGYVPLSKLAPDVILNDLKPELQLDHSAFEFEECVENFLDDGGYGAVYKGRYKGQTVAVKLFNVIGMIHPHKMQRQEATVLRCLSHPSIVSLLGVSFQPRVIVMELATKGSLGHVLKTGRPLDRDIQHRIALQVVDGLAYLHQMMVVYRDMKPDNVLIYSLDLNSPINAKVSDYGIARFATLDGLLAQEGTPAYRAPEVIRGETYSFKADVFSYGITLYVLVTGGRHPFDEFEFKSEMDRAIAEGMTMPPITQRGASPWPDMESILNSCLYNTPDQRPQAKEIVERLKNPEVQSLKCFSLVSKAASLECFTVQLSERGGLMLWFTSGTMEHVELANVNLLDPTLKSQGTYFPHGRILCLEPITRRYLLVGSQMSRIWLYDTHSGEFRHSTSLLSDHVLCIKYIAGSTEDLVFAGLANGIIAVFPVSDIISESNAVPMCLSPSHLSEPVRCMEVQVNKRLLYASCGSKVAIFSTRLGISMEQIFNTLPYSKYPNPPIYTMALGTSLLLLSHMGLPEVQVWEVGRQRVPTTTPKLRHTFNMAKMFGLSGRQGRVTSLTLVQDNSMAWVGTGGGHIALVDLKSISAVVITHRYTGAVRSLLYLRPTGNVKYSAVLSGGLGFRDQPGDVCKTPEKEYSCLAIWDPNFDQTSRMFQKYLQMRQEKERDQVKSVTFKLSK